jgi:hypothetical protein
MLNLQNGSQAVYLKE